MNANHREKKLYLIFFSMAHKAFTKTNILDFFSQNVPQFDKQRASKDCYESLCKEISLLQFYRCFSFALVLHASTHDILSFGSSLGKTCAERKALWNLDPSYFALEKYIIVFRVRKCRKNTQLTFGSSKPCAQCIVALNLFGVNKVYYSKVNSGFECENVCTMCNEYNTKSRVIVSL